MHGVMQIDILRDAWIPTDAGVLSPVDALLNARRPNWRRGDWNAATLLFLHAMVQSAVVLNGRCGNRAEWIALLESPPADLMQWLDGFDAGPLPWQCPTAKDAYPVAAVLPETPGENALKKSSDILKWQQHAPESLPFPEALIAIISYQFWGIPGGRGYREGCRGRSPMTTVVEPEGIDGSLWDRVWLNVFPKEVWDARYRSGAPFEFPWKKPLPSEPVTPDNAHSLEMLWQMPRRWRLKVDEDGLVRTVYQEGNGRNYTGWEFPLTGFFYASTKEWVEMKMNPQIGFKEWASIAAGLNQRARVPAVVNRYLEDRLWRGKPIRLRCFGWALGDAAAVGAWVDLPVPYYHDVDHEKLEEAISTAERVRSHLAGALKGVEKYLANEAVRLHQTLEAEFYRRASASDWEGWEKQLRSKARELYWDIATLHRHDMIEVSKTMARL
jgi:CRISPR type I-E-associated protein CasA/Cse1